MDEHRSNEKASITTRTTSPSRACAILTEDPSKRKTGSVSKARAIMRDKTPKTPVEDRVTDGQIQSLHSVYDLKSAIMTLDNMAPKEDPRSPEALSSAKVQEKLKQNSKSNGSNESDSESEGSRGSLQSVLKKSRVNWHQITGQLGLSKQKEEEDTEFPNFDGQTEGELRQHLNLPRISRDCNDTATAHPNHPFIWHTENLWCIKCESECGICKSSCCKLSECSQKLSNIDTATKEKRLMSTTLRAINNVCYKGVDLPTFLTCTSCKKRVCPGCCGICSERIICADLQCRDCKPDPWAMCDWHDEFELPVASPKNAEDGKEVSGGLPGSNSSLTASSDRHAMASTSTMAITTPRRTDNWRRSDPPRSLDRSANRISALTRRAFSNVGSERPTNMEPR